MTTDTEIPDTDVSADALTPEEQALFDTRGGEVETPDAKPEAKAPEPVAEKAPEPEKEPEVQKLVPHGAFEEERQRRKEAQQQLQAEREARARAEGQLQALNAGQKPAGMTEQERIDWDKDPIAAGKALQAKLDAQERNAKQETEFRSEMQRIAQIGTRHAEKFAATQPHFFDSKDDAGNTVAGAYNFMRAKAAEMVRAQHPGAPQAQIDLAVDLAERNHIEACLQNGENAAEKLWDLAVQQGYKAPVKAAAAPAGKTEAERIAVLEQAQAASRSLGAAPGGGGSASLSLDDLANLSDEEFAEATKGGKWEKLRRQGVLG